MEEGFKHLLEILLVILVAIAFLTAIYFLKDVMLEKIVEIKGIFSNIFSFS